VIRTDYTPASLQAALKGQDAVIGLLAGAIVDTVQIKLIDAAIAAGVKRYVSSEFGSDTDDDAVVKAVPGLFTAKQLARDYLKGKEKQGLSWTGIVNGPFFDWVSAVAW
jgi:hypothetical protein